MARRDVLPGLPQAVLAVALAFAAVPALSGEPSPVPRPSVRVLWIDSVEITPLTYQTMTGEATRIFGKMGVDLLIRRGAPETISTGPELRVIPLLRSATGDRPILGEILRGPARDGVTPIWIYHPQVVRFAAPPGSYCSWLEQQHRQGIALGRVIAHEAVHALAPELPHARKGLMALRMVTPLHSLIEVDAATRVAVAAAAARWATLASAAAGAEPAATAPEPD